MYDLARKYYTYALLDPRKPGCYQYGTYHFEYEPFYVGKGTGYRINAHFTEARRLMGQLDARTPTVAEPLVPPSSVPLRPKEEQKLLRIIEIMRATGEKPIAVKIKKDMNEFESFEHETELIGTIGRDKKRMGPLTNETDGTQFRGTSAQVLMNGVTGINNVIDPARLSIDVKTGLTELAEAVNVDIDHSYRPSRREGMVKLADVKAHSLFSEGNDCLLVADGHLSRLNTDYTITPLTALAAPQNTMRYALVGDLICFCNGTENGVCRLHAGVQPWVYEDIYQDSDYSELKSEADTALAGIKGLAGADKDYYENNIGDLDDFVHVLYGNTDKLNKYLAYSAPVGKHVEYHSGRVYVGSGNFVFYSEPFTYHWFNQYTNFLPFESEVRMIKSVKDGIYIGTEHKVWFARGSGPTDFQLDLVSDDPAIEHTDASTWAENFGLEKIFGLSAIWTGGKGIYLGAPGGVLINLTKDKVAYPGAIDGCSFCDQDKYITVLNI